MRAPALLLVTTFALAACDASPARVAEPTVQDSAGVRIVEHAPASAPTFTLGTEPLVRIGDTGADELTLFGIAGGVLQPGVGFTVADGGNYRLLRWSLEGELLGMAGRRGEGPGEFQTVAWLQPVGGTLAVYDSRARRISFFDPDGTFLRSIQLDMDPPEPKTDDGIWASGSALAVTGSSEMIAYPMAYADPVGEAGPLPVYGDLAVYDSLTAPVRALGSLTLLEWYEDPSMEGFPLANRLETPRLHWSGRDDAMVIADVVDHRLDVFEAGHRTTVVLESRARLPFRPDSIPDEYHLAADSLQAYRDVRIDGMGRIWVKPAVTAGDPTTVWRIFGLAGARLGDLALPTDATVLDASGDLILMSRRSALDEESVELWALHEPQ
jgi:hypothetical protein